MRDTKTNLRNMYAETNDISKDCAQLEKYIVELESFKTKLDNKKEIEKYLETRDQFERLFDKVENYCYLIYCENGEDDDQHLEFNKNIKKLNNILSYNRKVNDELVGEMIQNENNKVYDLSVMFNNSPEFYLYKLNKMKHEYAYSGSWLENYNTHNEIFEQDLDNLMFQFDSMVYEDIEISKGKFVTPRSKEFIVECLESNDEVLIKNTLKSLNNSIENNLDKIAPSFIEMMQEFSYLLKLDIESKHIFNHIGFFDLDIYKKCLERISSRLDINHKYYEVIRKILGLDSFHEYDKYLDTIDIPYRIYSFEESKDILVNSVSILGEKYQKDLRAALDSNWYNPSKQSKKLDVLMYINVYDNHPYVHVKSAGDVVDITALAGQFGAAMYYYYMNENNVYNAVCSNRLLMEAYCTVSEFLTYMYMIENASDPYEKFLYLDCFVRVLKYELVETFYEIEFLQCVLDKNGESISIKEMCDKRMELLRKYCGDAIENMEDSYFSWLAKKDFSDMYMSYRNSIKTVIAISVINNLKNNENYKNLFVNSLKFECESSTFKRLYYLAVEHDNMNWIDIAFDFYNNIIDQYEKSADELKDLNN